MDEKILAKVGPLMTRFCGLGIKMINDKVRNRFYDQLLKECGGKKCIEVGGGSGLLTLLALKHGAEHIVCFEMEVKVCEVLKDVVEHCGYNDKVTIINEKFKSSSIEKYNLQNYDLIFHELFGDNIWNDLGWPIRSTFDRRIDIPIIPNLCINDFYIFDVKEESVSRINNLTQKIPEFNPGVDIELKFIEYYNKCIEYFNIKGNEDSECIVKKINVKTFSSEIKKEFIGEIKHYHRYLFDLNSSDYDDIFIKFKLPKKENPYVLLPIYRVGSSDNILRLDESENSWEKSDAFLITTKKENVWFELNMINGTIKIDDIVVSSGVPLWYD